jgi:hypothetical protein
MGWEGEPLQAGAITRDQVLLDEGIAGEEIIIERALEKPTDFLAALVGQAVAVRHEHHTALP